MRTIAEIMTEHLSANYRESSDCSAEEIARYRVDQYNQSEGDLKGYDCPKCRNKGIIMGLSDTLEEYTYQCSCIAIRQSIYRVKSSGMQNLLEKYTFANYKTDNQWQKIVFGKATDYAENPQGWFFIGGQVGSGKTHICTAIINQLIENGTNCKYMMWRDEASRLKATVNDDSYTAAINILKDIQCLYIDDFFKGGNVTAGDINLAFEILNSRYNKGLPTIISTEKNIEQLMDIDEGIASRIFEKSKSHLVEISQGIGKNFRLKGE